MTGQTTPANLTVIVPYRDNRAALNRLVASLPPTLPLVVVDDVSEIRPDLEVLGRRPHTRVLRRLQRGYFSGAVNVGLRACDTDVLVLNQDIELIGDGWLAGLDDLRRKGYGIIGDGVMEHPAWKRGYVQGTWMFMSRAAINTVGGLDEQHWPLWGATAEWQLRACRRGFRAYPFRAAGVWFRHARRGAYGSSIERLLQEQPGKRDWFVRTPPLVSVVVPCFNYGRYLPDLVASLIGGDSSLGPQPGQTFQGFELILVDDGSTDDTPEICRTLADPWRGIHTIRRANGGTAAAMNTGIAAAHGRYIQALDADDMLEPEALERLLRIVEADPRAVPYSDLRQFKDGARGKAWKMREYDFEVLLEKNMVPAGIMFSRAAWEQVGGYPERFNARQDWSFAVALGAAGYCGVRVPEPLYLYRRAGQNRTLTNTDRASMARFAAQMRAQFPQLYRGERPMGCCGGSRRTTPSTSGGRAAQPLVGAAGMVLLEYVGGNAGTMTWHGPITRTRYLFGKSRPRGYVDARDVAGMLEMREGREALFRVVPEETKPALEPELEPMAEGVEVLEEGAEFKAELVVPAPELTADSMTAAELIAAVDGAPRQVVEDWLKQEEAGRRRVTVLRALRAALGEGEA